MTELPRLSVCMATYNGRQYVVEQVWSILGQLGDTDELVIVDDASRDETPALIRGIGDTRITLVEGKVNLGYVKAFERALTLSRGQFIFLADQDDVWPEDRVRLMSEALEHSCVVAGNVAILGGSPRITSPFGSQDWRLDGDPSIHPWGWIFRLAMSNAPYFGSAMAVRRDLLDIALPFPASVRELHDAWLALVGLSLRSITHLPDRVVLRREHGANASGTRRAWPAVLRGRWWFLRMLIDARRRARAYENRASQGAALP